MSAHATQFGDRIPGPTRTTLRRHPAPRAGGGDPGADPRSPAPSSSTAPSVRDWKRLTVRAVAERAGVNERTVYRYFGSERGLRDAVMHRNEQEAGIDLDGMQLEDIATVAAQIFDHVSPVPEGAASTPRSDPGRCQGPPASRRCSAPSRRRTGQWPDEDRCVVAAVFDVLWSVASYERLVVDWQIDHERAVQGDHLGHRTGRAGRARRSRPRMSPTPPRHRRAAGAPLGVQKKRPTAPPPGPERTGELVRRDRPRRIKGSEEEVVPAGGHASHGRARQSDWNPLVLSRLHRSGPRGDPRTMSPAPVSAGGP